MLLRLVRYSLLSATANQPSGPSPYGSTNAYICSSKRPRASKNLLELDKKSLKPFFDDVIAARASMSTDPSPWRVG